MDAGMAWIVVGGLFEPLWVAALTKSSSSRGRAHYAWLALFVLFSICSIFFLGLGMEDMNIGVAYAMWTAIGAIITLAVSRLFFGEEIDRRKVLAVFLILTGIVGLELAGGV